MTARAVTGLKKDVGNLQQRLIGTCYGVSKEQLQVYLDEFVFGITAARWHVGSYKKGVDPTYGGQQDEFLHTPDP